jgi:hypothetical protein
MSVGGAPAHPAQAQVHFGHSRQNQTLGLATRRAGEFFDGASFTHPNPPSARVREMGLAFF